MLTMIASFAIAWIFLPVFMLVIGWCFLMVVKAICLPIDAVDAIKNSEVTNKQFLTGFYVVVAVLVVISQVI